MRSFYLDNAAATIALGAQIASQVERGDVIRLIGDLGAGKTTLARGFIQALCDDMTVPSPTYTLIQTYETLDFEIWHCDFYRLESPEEIWELGLLDMIDSLVSLIEWPEKLGAYMPQQGLTVTLQFSEIGRQAILTGDDTWETRLERF